MPGDEPAADLWQVHRATFPSTTPLASSSFEKRKTAQRKADIYSERVTVQISPEMRDDVDSLARELQRLKTTKEERITSNSVMRVAIRYFLDGFEPQASEPVNSEEDPLAAAKRIESQRR